jgi:hypothetical protein
MYFNFSNLLEENRIVTYQNYQPYYNSFITETQKIVVTATKIIFTVVFTRQITFLLTLGT